MLAFSHITCKILYDELELSDSLSFQSQFMTMIHQFPIHQLVAILKLTGLVSSPTRPVLHGQAETLIPAPTPGFRLKFLLLLCSHSWFQLFPAVNSSHVWPRILLNLPEDTSLYKIKYFSIILANVLLAKSIKCQIIASISTFIIINRNSVLHALLIRIRI